MRDARYALLVLGFCVIWSSAFAAGKLGLADAPPLTYLTLRFLAAGLTLTAVLAALGGFRGLTGREVALLAGLGVLNNALYLGLVFVGMTRVPSGLMTLIVSANPVLTALVAAPVLGERLTARKLAGLLLGVAGVAVIVRQRLAVGDDPGGMALAVGALVSLVAGTIAFKRAGLTRSILEANAVMVLAAGLALAPVALLAEDVGALRPTAGLAASLAWTALAVSVGGYALWFHLLRAGSATAASAYHFLMPPLGLLFGWAALGEPVHWPDLAGILPIAVGIALVTHPVTAPSRS
ncbi:MAG: DMT family transporter [Pseudomonadota bacterium]